ncbi:unnamed protein product [Microthlaspi erraticum]|uniref:Transcription repressor n=1 Tax=Microthlaspi erraticum TaxID=1685480 RepID=A0A6D2JJL8_9BRAS|nr:unnamed protein product [Microthlaspi erraticum]CAA7045348.1 unnamed protein product [Microthlaspi erraticum]
MSTFLKKKLHLCFSTSGVLSPSIPSSPVVISSHNPNHHHTPSIFINNFNSLYDHLSVSSPLYRGNRPGNLSADAAFTKPKSRETESDDPTRPFGGGLHPSPRRANDDEGEEEEEEEEEDNSSVVSKLLSGGMAFTKHIESPDPYRDFGRSMREMVEARDLTRDVAADREYLQELLFCYLSLNPEHTHKFIVSAFADTLLWLLFPSSAPSPDNFRSQSI